MKQIRICSLGVLAATMAVAATSVPGIVSATKTAGTAWTDADGTFTRGAGPSSFNLGGGTGISLNQPQIWFERRLNVPNVAYAGGATSGGVKVEWLSGTDALGTSYAIVGGVATAFDTGRVLPTGTLVNSYHLYSNRNNAGTAGNSIYSGEIVFTHQILGVIASNQFTLPNSADGRLNATNAAFGRPGVTSYPTGNNASFEGANDRLQVEQVGPGSYKLVFQFTGNGPDNLRVLTATPEPAIWATFFLIGAVLVAAARRTRKAQQTA